MIVIMLLIEFSESRDAQGWEPHQTECFVKALYYALYLCPYGGFETTTPNLVAQMLDQRYRFNSATAAWISGFRQGYSVRFQHCLVCIGLQYLHIPIIGIMFCWAFVSGNALLWASLSMDMYNVYDYVNEVEAQTIFISIYP